MSIRSLMFLCAVCLMAFTATLAAQTAGEQTGPIESSGAGRQAGTRGISEINPDKVHPHLVLALEALDRAEKAAHKNRAVLSALREARDNIRMAEEHLQPVPEGLKVVNARCPIMGDVVLKDNTSPQLTRQHKGQTVGFCCEPCLTKWDALSDQEKDQRLRDAIAPLPGGGPPAR